MSKKLFFEDGSILEISTTPHDGRGMATAVYKRLIEFIDEELLDEFDISLQPNKRDDLEEVDLDELELDEEELAAFDDELISDEDDEEEWEFDDSDEDDDKEFAYK